MSFNIENMGAVYQSIPFQILTYKTNDDPLSEGYFNDLAGDNGFQGAIMTLGTIILSLTSEIMQILYISDLTETDIIVTKLL